MHTVFCVSSRVDSNVLSVLYRVHQRDSASRDAAQSTVQYSIVRVIVDTRVTRCCAIIRPSPELWETSDGRACKYCTFVKALNLLSLGIVPHDAGRRKYLQRT